MKYEMGSLNTGLIDIKCTAKGIEI